jgi:hypothetical protein
MRQQLLEFGIIRPSIRSQDKNHGIVSGVDKPVGVERCSAKGVACRKSGILTEKTCPCHSIEYGV